MPLDNDGWDEALFGRRNAEDEKEAKAAGPLKRGARSRWGDEPLPEYRGSPAPIDQLIARLGNAREDVPGEERVAEVTAEIRALLPDVFLGVADDMTEEELRLRETVFAAEREHARFLNEHDEDAKPQDDDANGYVDAPQRQDPLDAYMQLLAFDGEPESLRAKIRTVRTQFRELFRTHPEDLEEAGSALVNLAEELEADLDTAEAEALEFQESSDQA